MKGKHCADHIDLIEMTQLLVESSFNSTLKFCISSIGEEIFQFLYLDIHFTSGILACWANNQFSL